MQTVSQLLDRKGRQVWTIDPDASVLDAIAEMADKDVGALVVMEGARVVGVISERQYTRGVALAGRSSRDTRVRDIMRP
ncbi:MAG: CBS domain-containing protein, partial [Thiohalocapsa sp.]